MSVWDPRSSHNSGTKSIAGEFGTTIPTGVHLSPDGTKMFVCGGTIVVRYNLSKPWDVTTATYVHQVNLSANDASLDGLFLSPDGTKLFTAGYSSDMVRRYTLSTAWNLTTAALFHSLNMATIDSDIRGVFLSSDGMKLFVSGSNTDRLYAYNCPSAWAISTAAAAGSLDVSAVTPYLRSSYISSDGLMVFFMDYYGRLSRYHLTTPWSLSTAGARITDKANFAEVGTISAGGFFFKPDGTRAYGTSGANDSVEQADFGIDRWGVVPI